MINHRYWQSKRVSTDNRHLLVTREGWFLFWIIPLYTRDA